MNIEDIDIERLRQDLLNHFTAAYFTVSPIALMDMTTVENASDEELIDIAIRNKFDLERYVIHKYR